MNSSSISTSVASFAFATDAFILNSEDNVDAFSRF